MDREFTALVSCDPTGIIGNNGKLPWYLPEDLTHYRQTTLNQIVIMGYKTFLSMPHRAFEHRHSFVFTRKHSVDAQSATSVDSLEDLFRKLENSSLASKKAFVIGGAEIFQLFFSHDLIKNVILTELKEEFPGDTLFPLWKIQTWQRKLLKENSQFSIFKYSKNSFENTGSGV
jgi:dihydrofolate reductase